MHHRVVVVGEPVAGPGRSADAVVLIGPLGRGHVAGPNGGGVVHPLVLEEVPGLPLHDVGPVHGDVVVPVGADVLVTRAEHVEELVHDHVDGLHEMIMYNNGCCA